MKRTLAQQQKLEALMRTDIENMPYKYRDVRYMYYHGMNGYKDMSNKEINEAFIEQEIEITKEDKEWASYQLKNK